MAAAGSVKDILHFLKTAYLHDLQYVALLFNHFGVWECRNPLHFIEIQFWISVGFRRGKPLK